MLSSMYSQKITVLNKLKRSDSANGTDTWYKTVLTDGVWYRQVERTATGNAIYIGTYINVLIPFHDEFLNYSEWKNPGMQSGHYTVSAGDYIVLGDVSEDVNSSNIVSVMASYGENACLVRAHIVSHNRFGARVQLKIEGVCNG